MLVAERVDAADERSLAVQEPDRVGSGRTWVTRQGVFVDRIASAWLIRRFIDERARFKFVAAQQLSAGEGRAAIRHGRRGVHARRRGLHVPNTPQALRSRRPRVGGDRRDRPRHRLQGREVRPAGDRGRAQPVARHRRASTTMTRLGWSEGFPVFDDLYAFYSTQRSDNMKWITRERPKDRPCGLSLVDRAVHRSTNRNFCSSRRARCFAPPRRRARSRTTSRVWNCRMTGRCALSMR